MSVHIELRHTDGLLDRFRSKGSAEPAEAKPKKTASQKAGMVAKGAVKIVGAFGQGISDGLKVNENNKKCVKAMDVLEAIDKDEDIPSALSAVNSACRPADNRLCKRFANSMEARSPETVEMMKKSGEAALCKMNM